MQKPENLSKNMEFEKEDIKEFTKGDYMDLIRQNQYIEFLFKFGILSLLALLDEFERTNNFRQCKNIKEALEFYNSTMQDTEKFEKLPTRWDSEALFNLKEPFNLFGFRKCATPEEISMAIAEMKYELNLKGNEYN